MATPPLPPLTQAQRRNAQLAMHIQRMWAALDGNRGVPRALTDPRYLMMMFSKESSYGTGEPTQDNYHGWFQLAVERDPPRVDSWLSYAAHRRLVAEQLNLLAAQNPNDRDAILTVNGQRITQWTEALVRQHFANNPYIQTVGALMAGAHNWNTRRLNLADGQLSPEHMASLAYMLHVIPRAAQVIAANLDDRRPLTDLLRESVAREFPGQPHRITQINAMILRNSDVFGGGTLSPMSTLLRWTSRRLRPVLEHFPELATVSVASDTPVLLREPTLVPRPQ